MSFRTAYGYVHSENGWRMCNRDECEVPTMPDETLRRWMSTAPVRRGAAATILAAWVIWYHRNVEPIGSPVWGWSATNDVATSNHLSGTALDLNAPRYPWGRRVMPADRIAKVRQGLDLFEGTVFWGADWQRADEMHYQCALPEGDRRNEEFAAELRTGHLGIYGPPDPKAFPLPRQAGPWGPTWFFGPIDGPEQSVSGQWVGEPPQWREALGRWQAAAGVPVTKRWDEATRRACQAIQMAHRWQPFPGNGHIFEGEWNVVVRDGERPDYALLDDPARRPGVTYADVSEHQGAPIDDRYPYPVVMFRVNNGDTIDQRAHENLDAAIRLVDAGRLAAFGVYSFWRPGEDTFGALRRFVGDRPHPRMWVMVDVESAEGSVKGPVPPGQSAGANEMVAKVREWLGPHRVMGYWNMRADPQHWPDRPESVPFVVPDYSAERGRPRFPYPGWRVHQYTQTGRCDPWSGDVDLNYFPGTVREFLDMLGLAPLAETPTAEPEPGPVPAPQPDPAPAPQPAQTTGVPGMSTRLGPITGPGTSAARFGVGGTDLGICRRLPNGRTAVVLGDTFEEFTVGGRGWRSPLILFTDDTDLPALEDGITFHAAVGGDYARQLWAYHHDGPPWTNGGFSTVLPSDILVVGTTVYLFVSVCRGLGEVLWTEIAVSEDNGATWRNGGPGATRDGNHEGGFQRGITWELGPDGWVYILGSRWLTDGGGSNVRLWRVRPEHLLDRGRWESWGWDGRSWRWGAPASDILPGGVKVREMNLRHLDGRFVWVYTQTAPDVRIVCKAVAAVTDNMHTAPTTTVVRNVPWELEAADRDNTAAQPYGGYIVPGSTLDRLHVLVSQWDTRDNWPYHIVQFVHTVHADVPRPAPQPEPTTVEGLAAENYLLARAVLAATGGRLDELPAEPDPDTLDAALDTNEALWRLAALHNADTGGI